MKQFTVNSTELFNRSVLTNDACGSQTFSGQGHHIVGLATWCYLNPSFRTHRFICSTVLLDTSALLKVEPPHENPKMHPEQPVAAPQHLTHLSPMAADGESSLSSVSCGRGVL